MGGRFIRTSSNLGPGGTVPLIYNLVGQRLIDRAQREETPRSDEMPATLADFRATAEMAHALASVDLHAAAIVSGWLDSTVRYWEDDDTYDEVRDIAEDLDADLRNGRY